MGQPVEPEPDAGLITATPVEPATRLTFPLGAMSDAQTPPPPPPPVREQIVGLLDAQQAETGRLHQALAAQAEQYASVEKRFNEILDRAEMELRALKAEAKARKWKRRARAAEQKLEGQV